MFGTKKVQASKVNGRLIIRVGGGYMNAEQFMDQYGRIEAIKMMSIEDSIMEDDSIDENNVDVVNQGARTLGNLL